MPDGGEANYPFSKSFTMPPRKVFLLDEEEDNHDAFALLPAWHDTLIAVKAFTYYPDNPEPDYKSLYSKIMLFDRAHGEPLALVDGTSVTFWRTAGISGDCLGSVFPHPCNATVTTPASTSSASSANAHFS